MDHYRQKGNIHASTRRASLTSEIRQVQNVALADATAKAGVSPWTKAMFKVRVFWAKVDVCVRSNVT
jgi:hypothetical protein